MNETLPRVPHTAGARAVVWLALGLLALVPLRAPEAPARILPVPHGAGCRFEEVTAVGSLCDCRDLSGRQRRLLGVPIPLAGSGPFDLEALPGIGPALAASIVRERERAGDYASVADLSRVRGIGPRTVERLRPFVVAGPPDAACPGGSGAGGE